MIATFQRIVLLFAGLLLWCGRLPADEQNPNRPSINRVTMDVYVRENSARCDALRQYLRKLATQRQGLDVVVHILNGNSELKSRLIELGQRYNVKELGLPAVHTMDGFRVGYTDSSAGQRAIEEMLTIEIFTRSSCPHCQQAKRFLQRLAPQWPALRFVNCDIVLDEQERRRLEKLTQQYHVFASSVPAFHLCGQLKTGYLGDSITGVEIESMLRKAARMLPPKQRPVNNLLRSSSASNFRFSQAKVGKTSIHASLAKWWFGDDGTALAAVKLTETFVVSLGHNIVTATSAAILWQTDDLDSLPDIDTFPELPGDASERPERARPSPSQGEAVTEIEVPFFGRLDARSLGMPTFTFLVGLVDGFNPCAMWVLMFLLSVLVNIRERKKILIIAGTFVVVSGLAYLAFMAAWLNVFMLIGMDRPAQIILGAVAIVIGMVNVKDFVAFGKGVSFKIPDSAKPGLYARMRQIMSAKSLVAALAGAIVLAVLVNMVELLCTAGLPAMYTQILALQEYSPLVNYLYLSLYIVAYMLDDSLLVAIVVITLSKKKLQEGEGRWLKLLSGAVILALGIVMIARPDWLV